MNEMPDDIAGFLDGLDPNSPSPGDNRSVIRSHSVHWVAGMEGADCRIEATGALTDRMAAE